MLLSKESLSKRVGSGIRAARLNKGYTIEQLAMLASMEYAQLSKIELGKVNTSIYQLHKILVALDPPSNIVYELFLGVQKPK